MSARGYSLTSLVTLCILSFFAGRFLQTFPSLPDSNSGPTIHSVGRKSKVLLEQPKQDITPLHVISNASAAYGGFSSYEEAFNAYGLLGDKEPQSVNDLGHTFYTVQPFQLLSWHPRSFLFPNFMSKDKADHIIALAEKRLHPSGLALKKGDTVEGTKNIRTSQGTFMGRSDDPDGILAWVEDKIAALTGIPASQGEPFNVLRYNLDQHYDSHYDSFNPDDGYAASKSQRIATVLLYLSDVEDGGETVFLLEGEGGLQRLQTIDYKACDTGIKIKPRAGDALLFWSAKPDCTLDKYALHGGCPVRQGTKWVATKWLRNV